MRKLIQALLITLGCFFAAGVYANEEEKKPSEVAVEVETDKGSDEKKPELRLFQQAPEGEETAENEKPNA